ncbi:MAG TPA: hypothetical protein VLZ54_09420 [Arenibacter sp.]|nr:hypothetical protein [Arenibacter sp.]
MNLERLRELCLNAIVFPTEILDWIREENLWNLWVPRQYGGLGATFTEGLKQLRHLSQIDGSLGWTVTLCSGANFFIGNLRPDVVHGIFDGSVGSVCFGGSGGVSGIAERQGDTYLISGRWRYATGAPYLTHFTINAKILENGKELKNTDGSPLVRSFLLGKNEVQIVADWHAMGLKATATRSFEVMAVRVHEKYSFAYGEVYLPDPQFKIDFAIFADLTLWANYIGMADHFLEEALTILPRERLANFMATIERADRELFKQAQEIENRTVTSSDWCEKEIRSIHLIAADSVRHLARAIFECYPSLGIRACSENRVLNQVFRDYFTATQHHIFTKDSV